MNVPSWSLDAELRRLSGQTDLNVWLHDVGLINDGEELSSIVTIDDWYRSGAETYSLRFAFLTASGARVECFMKACVAYSGGASLKEIFAEWISRRAVVESLGVSVPRLFIAGAAELVEEYIPYTLTDALRSAQDRSAVLRALGLTAGTLIGAGFSPLSAHDWRSRGEDVVLVDFGQDLGPTAIAVGSESGLLSELLDNLAKAGIELSTAESQTLGSSYEEAL